VTSARFFAALALASAIACGSRSEPSPPPAAPAKATTATAASTEAHADAGAVKLCEHRVPAELCTRCNPDLVPVFQAQGDWCEEHGVPESQCLKCNPNLTFTAAAAPQDWCKEHGVPESKCTKCNPRLVAQFVEAGDYCREHGYPESVCPICHPELPEAAGQKAPVFPEPGTKVRLASAETVADAGIQTQRAEKRRFGRTLDVVGQLEFNQNRLAQLSARGDAVVVEVKVDVGDEVKAGAPLLVLASSSVGGDQARLPAARARVATAESALSRERQLAERGISPRKAVEDAERDLAEARAELDTARSALTAAGSAPGESGGRYVLRAPFAGTVVARHAVAGKTATAGEELVKVADLSTMWVQLEIPEADAAAVRVGQPVRLVLEGMRGETRDARISRVAASIDPESRTLAARVELPNPDRALKAGVFVRAQIAITEQHDALLVPRDAVQAAESRSLVFVKKGEALFEPVAVQLGAGDGEVVEIVSGLEPGAEIVTTGAFLLKTEVMKESIGAGCCEVEEKK
jgi:cobalt-zinc-cadmium efflux system membrane fusion protein